MKFLALVFVTATSTAFAGEVHTLMKCDSVELKAQPTGTKMVARYVLGMDVNNADVWMEKSGEKHEARVDFQAGGFAEFAADVGGKAVVIKSTGPESFGLYHGKKKQASCKTFHVKGPEDSGSEGNEGSAD